MITPDIPVRTAYLTILSALGIGSISVPVFVDMVPVNIDPIPNTRVIITSQTTSIDAENKCGHGWKCTILLDIINEQSKGFANRDIVDMIEQQISDLIDIWTYADGDISIAPFTVYHTTFAGSHNMDLETPTRSITRKLVRYEHRLSPM
jgi:hypothetical protein